MKQPLTATAKEATEATAGIWAWAMTREMMGAAASSASGER